MSLGEPDPLAKTLWARDRRRRLRNGLRAGAMMGPLLMAGLAMTTHGPARPERGVGIMLVVAAGFTVVFLALVLGFSWPPRTRGISGGGRVILRYSSGYRVVQPLLVALAGTVGVAFALLDAAPAPGAAAGVLAITVVLVLALALAHRTTLDLTEAGIAQRSPWPGRRKAIAWGEVVAVEVDGFRAVVLRDRGRTTIKANLAYDGLPEFATALVAHVSPEGVVWPAARDLLNALAARLDEPDHDARTGRLEAWLESPARTGPACLILGGLAAGALVAASTTRPDLSSAIPAGWVSGAPEQLAELARTASVIVVAYEPAPPQPSRPIAGIRPTQTFWAEIGNGELEPARAAQVLGDAYLSRMEGATNGASLRDRGATTVNGVEMARVEVASDELHLIGYAVPLGDRLALLSYTCAPSECERLRSKFERSAAAMVGAAPSYLSSWSRAWELAAAGVIGLFAALILGVETVTALARRRPR